MLSAYLKRILRFDRLRLGCGPLMRIGGRVSCNPPVRAAFRATTLPAIVC